MTQNTLNLVWCQPRSYLWEEDWIRWLVRGFEVAEHIAPDLDCFPDRALYVLSSNFHPLRSLPDRFLEKLNGTRGKGLLHLSDEWFSGGYETYSAFDFVLRNHHSAIFDHPGIKTLPLGLTNGGMNEEASKPASQRRLLWSFAGTRTAARLEMLREFEHVTPNETHWYDMRQQEAPPLDRQAYKALLADSTYSPCPMGNVVLETFRVYESLEMGAVPLLVQRPRMPYYERLLPGHPMPSFGSWADARAFATEFARDPVELDALQKTIYGWWQSYKESLRKDVRAFITAGFEGCFESPLAQGWHYHTGLRHQAWQIAELVRHGNVASLSERAFMTARRLARGRLTAGQR
jgi:hypothetical protein